MPGRVPWWDVCPTVKGDRSAPAKTQDTKEAENAAGADQEAAGADTEAAAPADMEVNTTDPITPAF